MKIEVDEAFFLCDFLKKILTDNQFTAPPEINSEIEAILCMLF